MGLVCEKAKGKKKEKERGMRAGKKTTLHLNVAWQFLHPAPFV